MNYLMIETATDVCSVATAANGKVLDHREETGRGIHSRKLSLFTGELTGEDNNSLDAVVVSMGPGSYTGLRIGVSMAKAIAFGRDIPLIPVNTLQAMALGAKQQFKKPGILYCPLLDARRMEVYLALFDEEQNFVWDTQARIMESSLFEKALRQNEILFFGNGLPKCREILGAYKNACFLDNFEPSARYMVSIAEEKYAKKEFADTGSFEPFYLKDFVGHKSGKIQSVLKSKMGNS